MNAFIISLMLSFQASSLVHVAATDGMGVWDVPSKQSIMTYRMAMPTSFSHATMVSSESIRSRKIGLALAKKSRFGIIWHPSRQNQKSKQLFMMFI